MILSHARLPIPTLPREASLRSDTKTEVNPKRLTKHPEKINKRLIQYLTNDFFNDFLSSRRQGLSQNTILFYQRCLSKAIGIELSSYGINSFLAVLTCANGKLAYYRALRTICNWLHKQGKIEDNPIQLVDPPRTVKRILPTITRQQLEVLNDAVDTFRDKCIVNLLFDSGLRLNEICSIEPDNIDWQSKTLRVIVKGNREEKAVFTTNTARMMKDYLSKHMNNKTLFNMLRRGLQDMLRRLSEKVGFPCNAHAFRRGFASNLHKKGLSTLTIMHLGRWNSLDMVQRYTKSISFEDCMGLYREIDFG